MKIECILKRPGGSEITLGTTVYNFKPTSDDPEAPHVCEVSNRKHQKTLLKIPEAYRAAKGAKPSQDVQKALKDDEKKQTTGDPDIQNEEEMDEIVVSEDTRIEHAAAILKLMEEAGKESPGDLTNKQVLDFAEDEFGINVKNKVQIHRYANGCEAKVSRRKSPANMIKDLLIHIVDQYTEDDEPDELGADADDHAASLAENAEDAELDLEEEETELESDGDTDDDNSEEQDQDGEEE